MSEALEKLSLPEASWTLPELKATGQKFTYEFVGKTEEKTPYNNFLTGYCALYSLTSLYPFWTALAWSMENDVVKCKEYLYLAAYCQKCIWKWPDHNENHNSIGLVSLSRLDLFYMALIADADTEFIKELGVFFLCAIGKADQRNVRLFKVSYTRETSFYSGAHLEFVSIIPGKCGDSFDNG